MKTFKLKWKPWIHKTWMGCFAVIIVSVSVGKAQPVLFDFNNAPIHTSLPLSLTEGGITAYFDGTGSGFSIQEASVLGFTPQGFSGNIIYPNSVFKADLIIRVDRLLTDFSIMYSCQELGCDDAATMRVTLYSNGAYVGTDTKTASHPGTWPVDTLRCSFAEGFDSIVVHYDSRPPTCQDYGVIFMADNMLVTPKIPTSLEDRKESTGVFVFPNPASHSATISFLLLKPQVVSIDIYDNTGRFIERYYGDLLNAGEHHLNLDVNDHQYNDGIYMLRFQGESFTGLLRLVVIK